MAPTNMERYFDATVEESWPLLKHIVGWKYKVKAADELSKTINFGTPATGFTMGQNMDVNLIPTGEGMTVRITGTGKLATNVGNSSVQQKVANWVFNNLSEFIVKERAKT